jgi:hypothetical protein
MLTREDIQIKMRNSTNVHIFLIHLLHESGTSVEELAAKFDLVEDTITNILNSCHRPLNFTDYETTMIITAFETWLQRPGPPPTNYRMFEIGKDFGNH